MQKPFRVFLIDAKLSKWIVFYLHELLCLGGICTDV